MNPNWAEENLQTIRTLMERSAVYRRALAPIMLFAGTMGVLTATIGIWSQQFWSLQDSMQVFGTLWLGTAAIVVAGAFLTARRQAIKDKEHFWSPPTRRVGQALLPALSAGMFLGGLFTFVGLTNAITLTFIWLFFYGCALHSAGFFMLRGMKCFGWIFIGLAAVTASVLCFLNITRPLAFPASNIAITAHLLMGFFFGVLHLAYGAYLYLTEKRKNAA